MRAPPLLVLLWSSLCFAQAANYGAGSGRPALAEARKEMGIPSTDELRGKRHGQKLGRDVAIVISTDGTHYGSDFSFTPFGAGGVEALEKTVAQDRALVRDTLEGPLTADKAQKFAAAVVDPANVDQYRISWCGRFSVPFGLRFLAETARRLGLPAPLGVPLALGASVDTPELKVRDLGVGPTAPANLYHFVTHPAVAFVLPR